MKRDCFRKKLTTLITISTLGMVGFSLNGCGSSRNYVKNLNCPVISSEQLDWVMNSISITYGKDVTVHEFLKKGMISGGDYDTMKEELLKIYTPNEKITKENLSDITCYLFNRQNLIAKE
ncbi:MAG: hypothetical protein WC438_04635 [Candidatus Pacearchaeota archaeon]